MVLERVHGGGRKPCGSRVFPLVDEILDDLYLNER